MARELRIAGIASSEKTKNSNSVSKGYLFWTRFISHNMMAPETIASSDTICAKVEIFIGVGDAG